MLPLALSADSLYFCPTEIDSNSKRPISHFGLVHSDVILYICFIYATRLSRFRNSKKHGNYSNSKTNAFRDEVAVEVRVYDLILFYFPISQILTASIRLDLVAGRHRERS